MQTDAHVIRSDHRLCNQRQERHSIPRRFNVMWLSDFIVWLINNMVMVDISLTGRSRVRQVQDHALHTHVDRGQRPLQRRSGQTWKSELDAEIKVRGQSVEGEHGAEAQRAKASGEYMEAD